MRLVQGRRDNEALSPELVAAGRLIIEACTFRRGLKHDFHALEQVIEASLNSAEAIPAVEVLLARVREAHANYNLDFTEENQVLSALFAAQPIVVLNNLFAQEGQDDRSRFRGFFAHDDLVGSPLDRVPEATLLSWCDEDRTLRYGLIAARIVPFSRAHNSEKSDWKPSALALLEHAPDKIDVLRHYINHFQPRMWSESRAAAWEANAQLLGHLKNHSDTNLAAYAKLRHEELTQFLDDMKRQEFNSERRDNETFE